MLSVTRVSLLSLMVAATGVVLGGPAQAETVTVTEIVRQAGGNATITVPTVALTDASIGEEEVRALFATDDPKAVGAALSGLVARSVAIPEVRIEGGELRPDGTDTRGTVILSGLELTDVAHGIAGGVAVASASYEGSDGTRLAFGPFALSNLNMGYLFALAGLADGDGLDPRALESVWTSLSLGETSLTGENGTCSFGGINAGALLVRMPERTSLPALFEFMDKARATQAAADEAPAEEREAKTDAALDDAARLQSYYFDILTSYAADPLLFSAIDCDVTNEAGDPVTFAIGEVAVGEARPGTLPDIIVSGLSLANTGNDAGTATIGTMHILPTDYAAAAELFAGIGVRVDHAWMEANQRQLIPSFGGFEFADVEMDVPNTGSTAAPGSRIVGTIGGFSALFDGYLNGIPTDIRSSATDMVFELPRDPAAEVLASLGLNPLNVNYDLSARWDRARREIVVENLLLSAENGGTIILSGVIGNAKPQLFGLNQTAAHEATKALTVKELSLYVGDAGLLAKLIAMAAGQQRADPDQFRAALATMTQSVVLLGLGATPDSIKVAGALGTFLSAGGELALSAVALSPAGVNIYEMHNGGGDPARILKQFTLTVGGDVAAAEPAPVEEPAAEEPPAEEIAPAEPAVQSAPEAMPGEGTAIPEADAKEKTQ